MKLRLLTRELVCVSNHARGDIPGFYDCLVQAVVGGYDRCLVLVLFEHSDSSLDTLMKGGAGHLMHLSLPSGGNGSANLR